MQRTFAPVRCRHPRYGRGCSLLVLASTAFRRAVSAGYLPSRGSRLRGLVASRRTPATVGSTLAFLYLPGRPAAATQTTQASELVLLLSLGPLGLLISLGISRLRRETARAARRRRTSRFGLALTEQLYQVSSDLSASRTPRRSWPPAFQSSVVQSMRRGRRVPVVGGWNGLRVLTEDRLSRAAHGLRGRPIDRRTVASDRRHSTRELLVVPADVQREVNHRTASETIPELREGDIVLPLMTGSRMVGAIVLAGMKGGILPSHEREFLIAAGRQAARAIARAQLYQAAERGRTEAEALRVDADSALQELQKAQEALRLSESRCRTLAARTTVSTWSARGFRKRSRSTLWLP